MGRYAFEYGPPPHGGIALGLDRMIMLMTGTHDIPTTGRSIFLFAMMRLCEHQQAIGTRVGEVNPEAQRINVENDSTLNYTYRNFMLT